MSYNNDYNNGYNSGYTNGSNNGYNNYNNQYNYQDNNQYNYQYNNQYQYNNAGYDYNNGYNNGYNAGYGSSAKIISSEMYNLIIGGVLLYGFIINAIMTAVFGDSIVSFVLTNPIAFYIGYFILAIAGTFMVRKSDNPVVSFIGYNLMVVPIGMVIAVSVTLYSAIGYNMIVATAFGITAAVTLVMMIISSIYPNFFLSMGRTLGITLLITVVVEAIMLIAGASLGIIDYVVVAIFCLYVGYDWAKANAIEKTVDNAIDSASELYLDIVNLFLRIMKILARANRN